MLADQSKLDFSLIKKDFPILAGFNRGKKLVYLDSAASAQKPMQVLQAIQHFYNHDYANIHRGIYELSERATNLFEACRERVRAFINAKESNEIIFTSGTTAGINLIANSFARLALQPQDEIIISELEHHSNIVPWYLLKDLFAINIKVIPINDDGSINLSAYKELLTPRTKLVAISHVSNALGTIQPIKEMVELAHANNTAVLVDGAQAIPHMPVDVSDLNCDFYVFSAHKLYGPTGVGVLYAKKKWIDLLPPYQGGGDMIETVSFQKITYAKGAQKFEAGTPNIAGVMGLRAAIDYISQFGMHAVYQHEQSLLQYCEKRMQEINGLRVIGTAKPKVGVMSFLLDDIHPHDIGTVLDHAGIAVRAGHHCAMPLMQRLQIPATVRASFGIYTDENDIDELINGTNDAKRLFA